MTERKIDDDFWRIVEHDTLRGERIIQASFDERVIGVSRFILFGEGIYKAMDFFELANTVANEYEIDFEAAIEAMDVSEARQIREWVNG